MLLFACSDFYFFCGGVVKNELFSLCSSILVCICEKVHEETHPPRLPLVSKPRLSNVCLLLLAFIPFSFACLALYAWCFRLLLSYRETWLSFATLGIVKPRAMWTNPLQFLVRLTAFKASSPSFPCNFSHYTLLKSGNVM